MRIEHIRGEQADGRHRLLADVTWEDSDRAPRTLIFEADAAHAGDLAPSAEAALVAVLPLAQWMSERRVHVEGRICPRLRDGLAAVMQLIALSFGRAPLRIEPAEGIGAPRPRPEPHAASFLSGGIDALALLRANRLEYPADHPGHVRDGILLFGLNTYDHTGDDPVPERWAAFEAHASRLSVFAEQVGVQLVRMRTNVRTFYPDFAAWTSVGFGAGTISTALAMGRRIDRVLFASAGLGMRLPMHGSHPSLDHHYSTEAVSVQHAQPAMTRLEKTKLVAEWDVALTVLRSCTYATLPPSGRINCGQCDKCLRTMLGLLAVGRLDRAITFPVHDVQPAMIESMRIESSLGAMFLAECAEALAARGRHDLARALRLRLARHRRTERRRALAAAVRQIVRR